jgi:tetratricopeptide (TPR) repeat protein
MEPRRLYEKGLNQLGSGNYADALDSFNRCEIITEGSYDVTVNRGWAYLKLGKYEEAIKDFDKAFATASGNDYRIKQLPVAHGGRGAAYAALGNYQKGIDDLNKSIEKPKSDGTYYPSDFFAEIHHGLAVSYAGLGDYQKSIEHYKVAAQRGHKNTQNYLKSKNIEY